MTANNYFKSIDSIPTDLSFDAILVLGGGVPEDISNPPTYTKERCKAASAIYHKSTTSSSLSLSSSSAPPPKLLTLSAGTAHLPQALSADGLPIWESTSSAAYLIHELNVPPQDIFAETTSYDTISNAFFARINFCDIAQWKKILIITNEFHMERTQLIFDWVFHAPNHGSSTSSIDDTNKNKPYELYYYPVPDVGLTEEAIKARKQKEQKSAMTVKNRLSQKYNSIEKIFEFLTNEHSFYTASKLVQRGMDDGSSTVDKLVQDSYGGISSSHSRDGLRSSSGSEISNMTTTTPFLYGTIFGIVTMGLIMTLSGRRGGAN